jgi:ankyrin repeat protein
VEAWLQVVGRGNCWVTLDDASTADQPVPTARHTSGSRRRLSLLSNAIDGYTPLHIAAECGHEDVVAYLIRSGADVEQVTSSGSTALQLAAGRGHLPVVRLLVDAKAIVTRPIDGGGGTVDGSPQHLLYERLGCTAVFFAASNGHEAVLRYLLETEPAETARRDTFGRTPLHFAAEGGHDAVVHCLIEAKSVVDAKDTHGRTPLFFAAFRGRVKCAELLIAAGADWGGGARTHAHTHTHTHAHAHVNAGHAHDGHDDLEASAHESDSVVWLPFQAAVIMGHEALVRVFLRFPDIIQAPMPTPTLQVFGQLWSRPNQPTPLAVAAESGHVAIAALLIDAGAGVNDPVCPGSDCTPLHTAAVREDEAMVRLLLSRGGVAPALLSIALVERVRAGRALVCRVQRELLLLEPGAQQPEQARLYLCGSAGMGKTTLMRSLRRSVSSSLFNFDASKPADRANPRERTPGVDVHRADIPGVGLLSIWDFAGQVLYARAHAPTHSRTRFPLLLLHPAARLAVLLWLR